jgi:hypothetical protein
MVHEPLIKLNVEPIITHKGVVGEVSAAMRLRAGQLSKKLWPPGKVLDQQSFIAFDVVRVRIRFIKAIARGNGGRGGTERRLLKGCLKLSYNIRSQRASVE